MEETAGEALLDHAECDIVDLLRRGASDREIALALGHTQKDLETKVRTIYAKLNVRSRVELVIAMTPRPGAV